MSYSIPLKKIIGTGRKPPVKTYKNYAGNSGAEINVGTSGDNINALARIFTYLAQAGASPRQNTITGQIIANHPMKSGALTSSIPLLRMWVKNHPESYNDPVWSYAYNLSRTSKAYSRAVKVNRRFGEDMKSYLDWRNYNSAVRRYKKGYRFYNNPSLLGSLDQRYISAASRLQAATQNRYQKISDLNKNYLSMFTNTYGAMIQPNAPVANPTMTKKGSNLLQKTRRSKERWGGGGGDAWNDTFDLGNNWGQAAAPVTDTWGDTMVLE